MDYLVYKIRLIIDATPANFMLAPAPPVQLPNPSHLANLSTSKRKMDLENYYHQLRLPINRFFQHMIVLMVFIIQCYKHYQWVLAMRFISLYRRIITSEQYSDHICFDIYIALHDDLIIIGYDYDVVSSMLVNVQSAYQSVGIKINVKKSIQPTMDDVNIKNEMKRHFK
jgi:hypothetical protein